MNPQHHISDAAQTAHYSCRLLVGLLQHPKRDHILRQAAMVHGEPDQVKTMAKLRAGLQHHAASLATIGNDLQMLADHIPPDLELAMPQVAVSRDNIIFPADLVT